MKHLFSIPEIGDHLIFKGGTSLSKAYKIIERFSEDIDISVSKHYLGFKNALDPSRATSNKKQQKLIKELSSASQEFVQGKLKASLLESFSNVLISAKEPWRIEPDEADPDKQTLLFHYPTFHSNGKQSYIRRVVKIEVGARGGLKPTNACHITPFIEEAIPRTFEQSSTTVTTLAAERTFWEKATILHMYSNFPEHKAIPERQSRHFFDFYKLLQSEIKERAEKNTNLLKQVLEHKKIYFRAGWAKYDDATQGSLRLTPNAAVLNILENDYKKMQEMFYESCLYALFILKYLGQLACAKRYQPSRELQLLGGWGCFDMVLRYAHLSSQHLCDAANRINVTNSLHCKQLSAVLKNNVADNAMI